MALNLKYSHMQSFPELDKCQGLNRLMWMVVVLSTLKSFVASGFH